MWTCRQVEQINISLCCAAIVRAARQMSAMTPCSLQVLDVHVQVTNNDLLHPDCTSAAKGRTGGQEQLLAAELPAFLA